MMAAIQSVITFLARLPIWGFNVGAITASPFLFYDEAPLAKAHPSWAGPIGLIPTLVWAIFCLSILGLLFVNIARGVRKVGYGDLKRRADRAQILENVVAENISEIINGIIIGLEQRLKLSPGEQSRISLYVDNGHDTLISVGRVATDPNFRKVGRKVLPRDQGCVGRAWNAAWVFEAAFSGHDYNSHPSHFGMPAEVVDALAMKPQFLAALRIDDGARSLAVIVFESMKQNRFDETRIKREMLDFSHYIKGALVALAPHLPKPLNISGEDL